MIYDGCHCGQTHLSIVPNGDVYACRRIPASAVGNIFEDGLADIWVGRMEEYRDVTRFEKCAGCELLRWCRRCPAVAAETSGSFYSPDPQCWNTVKGQ